MEKLVGLAFGRGPAVIVGVALDVILAPGAEGHLQNSHRFVFARTEPVFLITADPDFFPGLAHALVVADLHDRAVVDDNPQLGAGGVGLQTQALARPHGHEADGAVLVVGELFERAPGALDIRDRRFVIRDIVRYLFFHRVLSGFSPGCLSRVARSNKTGRALRSRTTWRKLRSAMGA